MSGPSFLSDKPIHSLVNFSNHHEFLPTKLQKEFIDLTQNFFSECAYNDTTIAVEDKSILERLHQLDIPLLYRIMSTFKNINHKFYFSQFIANISKVAKTNLAQYPTLSIYQIHVDAEENSDSPRFWGWILSEFADSSEFLLNYLDNSTGIINLKGVSPQILWTLQQFQKLYLSSERKKQIDIPHPLLAQLYLFAQEWQMKKLLTELKILYSHFCTVRSDYHGLTIGIPERAKALFEGFSDSKKNEVLSDLRSLKNKNLEIYKIDNEKLYDEIEGDGQSQRFIPEDPYGSIKRFVGRCTALPHEERLNFLSALSDFFARAVLHQKRLPIPKNYVQRFAKIDLPFLLSLLPEIRLAEEDRLVATIQMVSGYVFALPGALSVVAIVSLRNNQFNWISLQNISDKQGYRKLKHVLLDSTTDELQSENEKAHQKVNSQFLEKWKKAPLPQFEDREVSAEISQKKAINWDTLTTERKKELLAVFLKDLVQKIKPPVELKTLEEICKHLLFDEYFYSRDITSEIFVFISSPEFAQHFMQPDVVPLLRKAFIDKHFDVVTDYLYEQLPNFIPKKFKILILDLLKNVKEDQPLSLAQLVSYTVGLTYETGEIAKLFESFTSEDFQRWNREIMPEIDYTASFRKRFPIEAFTPFMLFLDKLKEISIKDSPFAPIIEQMKLFLRGKFSNSEVVDFFWSFNLMQFKGTSDSFKIQAAGRDLLRFLGDDSIKELFQKDRKSQEFFELILNHLNHCLDLHGKLNSETFSNLIKIREPSWKFYDRIIHIIWKFSLRNFTEYRDRTVSEYRTPDRNIIVELMYFFEHRHVKTWLQQICPNVEISAESLAKELTYCNKNDRQEPYEPILCLARVRQLMDPLSSELRDYLVNSFCQRGNDRDFEEDRNRKYLELFRKEKEAMIQFLSREDVQAVTRNSEEIEAHRRRLLNFLNPPNRGSASFFGFWSN